MRSVAGFFFFALLGLSIASAQGEKFTVQPERSEVDFSLSDVLHSVHGTFQVESGGVEFDLSTPQMSGLIVVAAGSGKSGSDTRDRRMSTSILEAPQFATATFSPKYRHGSISRSGDSTVQIDGVFTLHGTPHDLTLPMQIHIDGESCTAKTHFTIPYVKWGLKDPSTFVLRVDKEVGIDVTLAGRLSGTMTP